MLLIESILLLFLPKSFKLVALIYKQIKNMTTIAQRPSFKDKYDNFIGGKFVPPVKGEYFDNLSPIDGKVFTKAARSGKEDIELALDAAYAAFPSWSNSSAAFRSNILLRIAQVIEDNLEYLAIVETIDNGKAIRETRAADLPLCVDHFRYFAGVIRADESTVSVISK
jgi:aldehyde dehydrogenase